MPSLLKQVKRRNGFDDLLRIFIPNLGRNSLTFHGLLQNKNGFAFTNNHHGSLNT